MVIIKERRRRVQRYNREQLDGLGLRRSATAVAVHREKNQTQTGQHSTGENRYQECPISMPWSIIYVDHISTHSFMIINKSLHYLQCHHRHHL